MSKQPKSSQGADPRARIKLKNARGRIQVITAYAFEKQLGVCYTGKLLIDSSCAVSPPSIDSALVKVPNENRRTFFEQQLVNINEFDAEDGGAMKRWLYGRLIEEGFIANMYIAKVSETVGYGVFAAEDLSPGRMLAEYTGLARARRDSDWVNAYLFQYVDDAVIDASKRGNICRFVNHSVSAANARYLRVIVKGIQHIILVAKKHITCDEQVLFDYGSDYWRCRQAPQLL